MHFLQACKLILLIFWIFFSWIFSNTSTTLFTSVKNENQEKFIYLELENFHYFPNNVFSKFFFSFESKLNIQFQFILHSSAICTLIFESNILQISKYLVLYFQMKFTWLISVFIFGKNACKMLLNKNILSLMYFFDLQVKFV